MKILNLFLFQGQLCDNLVCRHIPLLFFSKLLATGNARNSYKIPACSSALHWNFPSPCSIKDQTHFFKTPSLRIKLNPKSSKQQQQSDGEEDAAIP